ncbi:hypothetical protein [Chondrinema litorale]|uniref:hypothetical protein n=1 Tax=Chondrinema litorale TaxID=2994555 RepID=UPI002543688D|nr:hypothetical protein [Chondrinema litorale]UZR97442.1 hypothetical protein OQ292_26910 [Chondrinema litorale]
MIELENPLWETFEGGYKIKYDVSTALKKLKVSSNQTEINELLNELFTNLYHQGDVGLASYFSLPHLIRTGIEKQLDNWQLPTLIAIIEIARQKNNPQMPAEYLLEYKNELKQITKLIDINQKTKWERTYSIAALSAIAAVNNQLDLAEIILEMESDDILKKFKLFLKSKNEFE